ncbi:hypothetical protein [Chitinophaga sp. CF418]|uniref:hypothetical protein n=1 Tax=Chitinophaga sp. CF418 TaxID=1855287 RepID=UPI00122CA88C|nr:hypothetical protein [Chitinophaga sp. CF418]
MNQHNGMRPQDIAVLLKIIISPSNWMNKDIAEALLLSPAEISYSLQRSTLAELIDPSKRKVMRKTFLEFIRYGLPHVFPAIKGAIAVGIPTAFSSPVMSKHLMTNQSSEMVVWPYLEGQARGESIIPLYPNAVKAALRDPELYELFALVDTMRLGKVREKEIALNLLKEKFDTRHA